MKCNIIIPFAILLLFLQSCSKPTNDFFSSKSLEVIQKNCEDSVRMWIFEYAEFPDTYIPLSFEKVGAGHSYYKGAEIIPFRRFTIEHTFQIKNKDFNLTHVTLLFELTPDYFVQDIRYKKQDSFSFSLSPRTFPPDYKLWSELYGRKFTKTDSLKWSENNHEIIFELSDAFTFNRYINPDGESQVLADSLIVQVNRYYYDERKEF